MMYFAIGFILGIAFYAMIAICGKYDLEEEKYNAEFRAMTHFRKLFQIEQIIIKATETKEPSVITIEKIKEIINSNQTN